MQGNICTKDPKIFAGTQPHGRGPEPRAVAGAGRGGEEEAADSLLRLRVPGTVVYCTILYCTAYQMSCDWSTADHVTTPLLPGLGHGGPGHGRLGGQALLHPGDRDARVPVLREGEEAGMSRSQSLHPATV